MNVVEKEGLKVIECPFCGRRISYNDTALYHEMPLCEDMISIKADRNTTIEIGFMSNDGRWIGVRG